jgi:hypothetical protein
LLAGIIFACALADQRSASALVVDVPGYGTWDIQVQNALFGNLNPPGPSMPWWGDQAAANIFAVASGPGFGPVFDNLGPFFAWELDDSNPSFVLVSMDAFCNGAPCFGDLGSADTAYSFVPSGPAGSPDTSFPYPWATATLVPGPVPFLGAAAVFGYSRKLRKRINRSKSYPVVSAID